MGKVRKKAQETLDELILNETMEIIVPLAFVCSFAVAYYGPNANILGDVGSDYWQYTRVEDPMDLFRPLLLMTFIDSCSIAVSIILLWKFNRVNFLYAGYKLMKKYWFLIAMNSAFNVNRVNI